MLLRECIRRLFRRVPVRAKRAKPCTACNTNAATLTAGKRAGGAWCTFSLCEICAVRWIREWVDDITGRESRREH